MRELKESLADRRYFVEWLREQPSQRRLNADDSRGCFIWAWLCDQGYPVQYVYMDYVQYRDCAGYITHAACPSWMQIYMRELLVRQEWAERHGCIGVSAHVARRVMSSLTTA